MQYVRGMIITASVLLVAWATWQFTKWSAEFRDKFLYLDNWSAVIFVLAIALAIGAIFRWFLIWEVRASRPRRKRK